jgi:hypothetical protein
MQPSILAVGESLVFVASKGEGKIHRDLCGFFLLDEFE